MSSKKLETIVYYERYVVIQSGIRTDKGQNYGTCSRKKNTWTSWIIYPRTTSTCPMTIPINHREMGAEAVHGMLERIELDQLSFDLRAAAAMNLPAT